LEAIFILFRIFYGFNPPDQARKARLNPLRGCKASPKRVQRPFGAPNPPDLNFLLGFPLLRPLEADLQHPLAPTSVGHPHFFPSFLIESQSTAIARIFLSRATAESAEGALRPQRDSSKEPWLTGFLENLAGWPRPLPDLTGPKDPPNDTPLLDAESVPELTERDSRSQKGSDSELNQEGFASRAFGFLPWQPSSPFDPQFRTVISLPFSLSWFSFYLKSRVPEGALGSTGGQRPPAESAAGALRPRVDPAVHSTAASYPKSWKHSQRAASSQATPESRSGTNSAPLRGASFPKATEGPFTIRLKEIEFLKAPLGGPPRSKIDLGVRNRAPFPPISFLFLSSPPLPSPIFPPFTPFGSSLTLSFLILRLSFFMVVRPRKAREQSSLIQGCKASYELDSLKIMRPFIYFQFFFGFKPFKFFFHFFDLFPFLGYPHYVTFYKVRKFYRICQRKAR
jgi:hypothetical protein